MSAQYSQQEFAKIAADEDLQSAASYFSSETAKGRNTYFAEQWARDLAELASLRRDAARYRAIRAGVISEAARFLSDAEYDAAVDEAMAKEQSR